jgi:hypothetical protein
MSGIEPIQTRTKRNPKDDEFPDLMAMIEKPKVQILEDKSQDVSESGIVQDESGPKKRGRKRERDEEYFQRAQEKIEAIKERLKTAKKDGMCVKERQRLRNQVSAQ